MNLPYIAKWISRNVVSISTLMSSVTLSVPALRMSQYFTSLDEEDLIAALVFTDGNDFQIPCQFSSLKTQIKVSVKGSLELDVSWTSWWSSDNHVTPSWAWAWILSTRSGEHGDRDSSVSVTWPLLPPPGVFFIKWTVIECCYVLSRLALRGIFFS